MLLKIKKIVANGKSMSHMQDNERAVKETTRAAAKSIGLQNQKKNILCTNVSREKYPTEVNKKQFFS